MPLTKEHLLRHQRWATKAALMVVSGFLALGVWYTIWNPLGEGVDEAAHFQYGLYLKEHQALPVQPWGDNQRPLLVSMGHHPPLYYFLTALVISWIDTSDASQILIPNPHFVWGVDHPRNGWNVHLHTPAERWPWRGTALAMHIVRGVTLLFGAIALWAVYQIGCRLYPLMPWIAVTGMAWLAFNPSFIYMCSAIHHDALLAALFATGLWWLVRLFGRPFTWREGVIGGLLLGAAMVTKIAGLSLAIVYGVGFLLFAIREKNIRAVWPGIVTTYGMAFLISGWWYIRNIVLYGDPLGWNMYRSIFWFNFRSGPFTWDTFVHEFLYQMAQTFWGAFGFMHITLPPIIWGTLWKIAGALMGIGLVAMALSPRRFFNQEQWAQWITILGGFLIHFATLVRHAVEVGGTGHARFLFPAGAGLVMLLAAGSHALTGFRIQPVVTGIVSIGLALYSVVIPCRFAIPLYPEPEVVSDIPWAKAQRVETCFGDAVCVRAAELSSEEEGLYYLTLYWQALPGDRPDLYARLRLQTPDKKTLIQDEFWPIPSFSTVAWEPSQIYVTRRQIRFPPGTSAGNYSLMLSLSVGRDGPYLPVQRAPEEETFAHITDILLDQTVPLVISGGVPRSDLFEHEIRLLGYSIEKTTYHPGETLTLTLFWQPLRTIQPNLVVFVHLLDSQGNLVAQHDSPPDQGRRPTPFWQPGEVVVDKHPIVLPAHLPPGRYTLTVGMYDWPGLQRLPVLEGPDAGRDHILIENILVSLSSSPQ